MHEAPPNIPEKTTDITSEHHSAVESLAQHETDQLDKYYTEHLDKETHHLDRIKQLKQVTIGDADAQKLINEVEDCALRYIESIANAESRIKKARYTLEGSAFRELSESLDKRRSKIHDVLIDSIKICNRYLFENYSEKEIPSGGILSVETLSFAAYDEKQRRRAIGDWAIELINEELRQYLAHTSKID